MQGKRLDRVNQLIKEEVSTRLWVGSSAGIHHAMS